MFDMLPRGIFSSSSSSSNTVCPVEGSLIETPTDPIFGTYTFYHFNKILSGAAVGLSCLICFLLIFLHATHLSKPREQIFIIKIAMFIPTYSLWSFVTLVIPQAQAYLLPWRDPVEAIALATFFLLLLEFISGSESERELFFSGLNIAPKKSSKSSTSGPVDPIAWYRKKWITIFQFPVLALLIAVATDITQAVGVYCLPSYSPHFAHLWLTIISDVSLALAFTSILQFYGATKKHLSAQRPLAKLISFKGIIGVSFIINILFTILHGAGALKPTATLNYADISVGIPTLVILLIMIPFALSLHWSYPWTPYVIRKHNGTENITLNHNKNNNDNTTTTHTHSSNDGTSSKNITLSQVEAGTYYTPTSYQGGFLGYRAYLSALNPMDVIRGVLFAGELLTSGAANAPDGVAASRNPGAVAGRMGGRYERVGGENYGQGQGYGVDLQSQDQRLGQGYTGYGAYPHAHTHGHQQAWHGQQGVGYGYEN